MRVRVGRYVRAKAITITSSARTTCFSGRGRGTVARPNPHRLDHQSRGNGGSEQPKSQEGKPHVKLLVQGQKDSWGCGRAKTR